MATRPTFTSYDSIPSFLRVGPLSSHQALRRRRRLRPRTAKTHTQFISGPSGGRFFAPWCAVVRGFNCSLSLVVSFGVLLSIRHLRLWVVWATRSSKACGYPSRSPSFFFLFSLHHDACLFRVMEIRRGERFAQFRHACRGGGGGGGGGGRGAHI